MYDVIIIGAGASGLLAAKELAGAGKRVIVLEARNRIGGRIHTLKPAGFEQSIESGAEFVHGRLPITMQLLKDAGILYTTVQGDMYRIQDDKVSEQDDFVAHSRYLNEKLESLEKDMTVADFLDRYFSEDKYSSLRESIQNFIQGYEAADIHRASVLAMKGDIMGTNEEEEQYRIEGGYTKLMNYLCDKVTESGGEIIVNSIVTSIHWEKNSVTVKTKNEKAYTGAKVLITIPLGVLQGGSEASPAFIPSLEKLNGLEKLGNGHVVKIILQFEKEIWNFSDRFKKEAPGFIFSDKQIPTWWTQMPGSPSLITGWLGGPDARDSSGLNDEDFLRIALNTLSDILGISVADLERLLKGKYISGWSDDPFAMGAYSYAAINSEDEKAQMKMPVDDTVFFAGEYLYSGPYSGTVEAAFYNSLETVKNILNSFANV